MKKLEQKRKLNNGGFSLVELIIVIAIMAVLIGILAPQYMRYLEKSRLAKDNSAIDSVKTAVEAALTEEDIYEEVVAASADPVLSFNGSGYSWTNGTTKLTTEVAKTVAAADAKMGSKTYTASGATAPTLTINRTTLKVTTGDGYTKTPTN